MAVGIYVSDYVLPNNLFPVGVLTSFQTSSVQPVYTMGSLTPTAFVPGRTTFEDTIIMHPLQYQDLLTSFNEESNFLTAGLGVDKFFEPEPEGPEDTISILQSIRETNDNLSR